MAVVAPLNSPSSITSNLFCFHWVAGNGNAFKTLAKEIENDGVKVYGVTLPGRNGRNTYQMPNSMKELTIMLFDLFMSKNETWNLVGKSLVFLGHSLGGIVAFELAKKLRYTPIPQVTLSKLIVSAVKDPESLTNDNWDGFTIERHTQDGDDLKAYIIKIGGLPDGVDPAFLDYALPTIRADYKLYEKYDMNSVIYNRQRSFYMDKVSCPLTCIVALDDVSVTEDMMTDWKIQTEGPTNTIRLSGSHFYLIEEGHKIGFANAVRQEIKLVLA